MRVNYVKCGNCFDLIKELPNKSIDVTFTSPPYNRKRNDTYGLYDDQINDYYTFLVKITKECLRVSKDKVIINIQQNFYNKVDFFEYLGYFSENISGIVIWQKTNPCPSGNYNKKTNKKSVTNSFEYFIFLTDDGKEFKHYGDKNLINHITTSVNSENFTNHSAVMKKEVCEWFIKYFTKKNDIVLDPFLGIGTTGLVCRQHNRNFIGFEIVPEYCKMAVKRIKCNG